MKESSRFYSSLGLLIILNIIIKPLWIFGIDRQVQNSVGTELYGTYFSLLNFSIVFSFLLDWGLTNFFNRQIAAREESLIEKAGTFLFIKLIFSLIYATIVFGVAYLTGVKQWGILLSVIAIQILTSIFIFLRSIITAQQWFTTDAWLSVLDKGLMILLCGSFIYYPSVAAKITIDKFLLIQIISTAIAVVCVIMVLKRRKVLLSLRLHSFINRKLFLSALPFGLIVLLMSAHYRLDGFLLERIHPNGAYEAGLYAGAYRLLDASNMIGYLLVSFLLPFLARQWSLQKSIDELVINSRHFLLLFSLFMITTAIFLAPWIQETLYHNADAKAIDILKWCLPALVGYSLVHIYGTVMTAGGEVVQFCKIVFFALVLNSILNLLLIPEFGAKGCCIAALISQGLCGIIAILYVQRKSGINIHYRSLLMYIFIGAILSGFYFIGRDWEINKWLLISGAGIITLTLAVVLKLVDIRNWKNILQLNNH